MGSVRSSILGSVIATIVVSLAMIEKNALRLIPEFSMQRAWSEILGMADQPWTGWLAYFLMGAIVCGVAFALLYSALPGRSPVIKGLAFGMLIWLVTMVVFMPLAGAGLFASDIGAKLAVMNLATNVIFGLVLGGIYKWDNAPAHRRQASQTR